MSYVAAFTPSASRAAVSQGHQSTFARPASASTRSGCIGRVAISSARRRARRAWGSMARGWGYSTPRALAETVDHIQTASELGAELRKLIAIPANDDDWSVKLLT